MPPTAFSILIAAAVLTAALSFFPVPAAAANAANAPQKVCEAGPLGFPEGSRGHPDRPGSVASSTAGFAMLVPDDVGGDGGRVVSWGNASSHGGEVDWDSDNSKTTKYDPKGSGYTSLVSNQGAFAALNPNGCARSWGWGVSGGLDHRFQGEGEGCGGDALRHDPGDNFHNFTAIFSERRHFVGLQGDGSILMWGYNDNDAQPTGTGFVAVYTTSDGGFVALHEDGSLYGWGASGTSDKDKERWAKVPAGNDYVAVYSGGKDECYPESFVALTASGSIRTWGRDDPDLVLHCGHASYGPDPSSVHQPPTGSGFAAVYSNKGAFAALHGDRTIHVWGDIKSGGNQDDVPGGGGFRAIYSTRHRFAALHRNGSIHSWGGFGPDFWAVYDYDYKMEPRYLVPWGEDGMPQGTGFIAIFSSNNLFVALHENGTIHGFGDTPVGPGFIAVSSNAAAFAALHRDGTIHTWGEYDQDADNVGTLEYTGCGATGGPVGGGFVAIHSSQKAFAAVHQDGSVHTWGHGQEGGRLPWKNLRDHPIVFSPSYDGSSSALCADGRAPVDLFKLTAAVNAGGAPATYSADTDALAEEAQNKTQTLVDALNVRADAAGARADAAEARILALESKMGCGTFNVEADTGACVLKVSKIMSDSD